MLPRVSVRVLCVVAYALCALVFPSFALSSTFNVPGDYSTIQAAIDAASNGDTIVIAAGTYKENINFTGKAITVKSASGAASTIIDGSAQDTVVKFITNETSSSVLDGFTIRNGVPAPGSSVNGGGIAIVYASPTISHNIITSNGGCAGVGIGVYMGSPLIQGNTISNNAQSGCSGGTGGGGIGVIGASQVQILDNVISNNSMGTDGGGISLFGAGNPVIRGNTLTGNTAGSEGGGMSLLNQSDAIVTNNLIILNNAPQGGGVYVSVPSGANGPIFVNNTFANNTAPVGGFQLYFIGFPNQTQFTNNILYGGIASVAAVYCDNSYSTAPPIFTFNDAFNPQGAAYDGSCTSETGSNGNISADPLFVNPTSDFHLQSTSPAIDAGSNSAPGIPQQDIANLPRILDGNGDCVPTVDLGAYEFTRPASLAVNPTALTFPDQVVGSTSIPISSVVTNTSANSVAVCSLTISGDFAETNTCGSTIAASATCSVNVTFTPTAHAPRSGTLQIVTNDAATYEAMLLSGNGVLPAASLSGTTLNFSAQLVGTTSSAQIVTLNNTGDGSLSISSVAVSGDFSQTNTCASTLAPSSSCTVSISFAPKTPGARSGSLTITDNASGSPRSIALTGAGTDFSLSSTSAGSTSASVTAGGTATYSLQVSPANGFSGTVTLACSGAPNLSSCTISPNSLTANGAAVPFSVSVMTTAPSIVPPFSYPRIPPQRIFSFALLACAALLFAILAHSHAHPHRRRRLVLLPAVALLLLCVISFASCGGGGNSPEHHPGTPPGTYSLTVTATAAGQSRTLTLTLTVN